jgi:hypothetical protein
VLKLSKNVLFGCDVVLFVNIYRINFQVNTTDKIYKKKRDVKSNINKNKIIIKYKKQTQNIRGSGKQIIN